MRPISTTRNVIKLSVLGIVPLIVAFVFLFSTDHKVGASASFPAPTHTGGPDENSCVVCHSSFKVNSGGGSVEILGVPRNYIPGQTYQLSVKTTEAGATIFGFMMTALDKDGLRAGTITAPVTTPQTTQVNDGFVNTATRQYISHTIDGLFTNGVFGSNTWNFTWTAPPLSVGRVGFYASGNGANGDGQTGGDYIYTTARPSGAGTAISNFDNDLQSEIAVFRPSDGGWYAYNFANGSTNYYSWGVSGDVIAPGDYDGDGITDLAVFRPSTGQWFLNMTTEGVVVRSFGLATDVPVPGDYDGDGKTDIAIFRPDSGIWAIWGSTAGVYSLSWGLSGDKAVQADYDGDGKTDIAVYRPSNGQWFIFKSTGGVNVASWGFAEDRPAQGDYDGDGKADLMVYRPSEGRWFAFMSTEGVRVTSWGVSGDIAAPADYDGDGKTDIGLYRPSSGQWFLFNSTDGVTVASWGIAGDVPVASGYLPPQ